MLLEADLMVMTVIAMRKADTRHEFVRLGNLLDRFEKSITISERKDLPGAIGPQCLDGQRSCARQRRWALGPHPKPRRDAVLENLQHQYAVAGVDPLGLGGVVMAVVTVAVMIIGAMLVTRMTVVMGAMTVAPSEMVMSMTASPHLPHEIVEAEQDQGGAGDLGKDVAGPLARLDAEPDDECAEHRGE